MSRGTKITIAVVLLLTAAATFGWAWYLSSGDLTRASAASGILQGFTALLAIPGLVLGILALRGPSSQAHPTDPNVKLVVPNMIPTYTQIDGAQRAGDHFVGIEVSNVGTRAVTLSGWGVNLPDGRNVVVIQPENWATPLPHELRPGAPPARLLIRADGLREIHFDQKIAYRDMRLYVNLGEGVKIWADGGVPLAD